MAKKTKLTDKELAWCEEYLRNPVGARAARFAGYSEKSARDIAYQLKKKPHIAAYLKERVKEIVPEDEVLLRLAQQARGDHANYYEALGSNDIHIDLEKLIADGLGHLIKSITRDGKTEAITKIEFYDAQAALVHLGKYHKLFTDKTEVTGKNGGPIQTEDVNLSDTERLKRLMALADAARARAGASGLAGTGGHE